ncbi:hypothetical protein PGB90_010370 [Kerria lacca]
MNVGGSTIFGTADHESDVNKENETKLLLDSYVEKEKRAEAPRMGSMFRSEEMALCQLFIQPEAAYSAVASMGEAGVVQFRDLNSDVNAFQRKFVSEVRRCDELERKLRYIEAEVNKDKVPIPENTISPNAPNPREIIDLENQLERTESEILELSHNAVNLKSNYLELLELKHVLEKTHSFFEESFCLQQQDSTTPTSSGNDSITKALISEDSQQVIRGRLGFVAGVVSRERVPGFERMLWRISRGNVFLRRAELAEPLEDPATGNEIYKTVFVAFFQGEQLKSRVKKVCSGYHASFYNCPSSYVDRQDLLKGVKTRIEDLNLVLNQTHDHRQRVLTTVAKELHGWSVMVRKMKAIYHSLNLFNMDVTKKCLIGECWVPLSDVPFIRQTLADGGKAVGSSIPSFLNVIETNENPPTFNRTNKFTQGFQNLIDSYGVASYREVNPALYTIITFPFLFGIMFGDAGHGLILTLFGGFMVLREQQFTQKKINNEVWNIFFSGRYIILLMGIFSIYTGIIYNDVFSKSINIFGSSWSVILKNNTIKDISEATLDPAVNYNQLPYPMGLDPVWQRSSIETSPTCAPSVLITFINMMLYKKNTENVLPCQPYMFQYQDQLQTIFLIISLCCIPIMLAGKPIYIMISKRRMQKRRYSVNNGDLNQEIEMKENESVSIPSENMTLQYHPEEQQQDDEHEEMSEILIHQVIETIEYVLSTVSHTASYLRLWALSLAHAQLSEVLWNMVLKAGLMSESYSGSILLYFTFGTWSVFTIAILVMMEGLSAFLHTLRLHWVEFMSKFYIGTGYPFQPFSFKLILESEEALEE